MLGKYLGQELTQIVWTLWSLQNDFREETSFFSRSFKLLMLGTEGKDLV
jgi:hypothetical protein